jgi:hypothetical protein
MNMTFPRVALAAAMLLALPALAAAGAGERGLQRLDGNGDGAISREEAVPAPRLALVFDSIDGNRDQRLDADELAAFRERARAARDEARAARFVRVDVDGNGRIEGAELDAHPRLLRLDGNADGAVDAAEWAQPRGRRCAGRHTR